MSSQGSDHCQITVSSCSKKEKIFQFLVIMLHLFLRKDSGLCACRMLRLVGQNEQFFPAVSELLLFLEQKKKYSQNIKLGVRMLVHILDVVTSPVCDMNHCEPDSVKGFKYLKRPKRCLLGLSNLFKQVRHLTPLTESSPCKSMELVTLSSLVFLQSH